MNSKLLKNMAVGSLVLMQGVMVSTPVVFAAEMNINESTNIDSIIYPKVNDNCFETNNNSDGTLKITGYKCGIGNRAGNEEIGNLEIPRTINGKEVTVIGSLNFNPYGGYVENIKLHNGIKKIEDGGFSVTFSGPNGEETTPRVKNIIIPSSVESLGEWSFKSLGLENVIFEKGSPIINLNKSFSNNPNLKTLKLPENIISLNEYDIPSSLEYLDMSECKNLTTINAEALNARTMQGLQLKEFIVPASVTYIDKDFLSSNGDVLPILRFEKGTKIETLNFMNRINEIYVPSSVKNVITLMANKVYFEENSSFTSTDDLLAFGNIANFPDNLTHINSLHMFIEEFRKNITIPESVLTFGEGAFSKDISESIEFTTMTPPENLLYTSFNYGNPPVIIVPKGAKSAYDEKLKPIYTGYDSFTIIEKE